MTECETETNAKDDNERRPWQFINRYCLLLFSNVKNFDIGIEPAHLTATFCYHPYSFVLGNDAILEYQQLSLLDTLFDCYTIGATATQLCVFPSPKSSYHTKCSVNDNGMPLQDSPASRSCIT